jgi:glycine cleavage system H protein
MECPEGLRYTKEHEWVRADGGTATVGITDFAQHELGDVVFVELPAVGGVIVKDQPFGVVESVKAVSDVYAPVSGTVVEINVAVRATPELINQDPYGAGWLLRVQVAEAAQLGELMDAAAYREYIRHTAT